VTWRWQPWPPSARRAWAGLASLTALGTLAWPSCPARPSCQSAYTRMGGVCVVVWVGGETRADEYSVNTPPLGKGQGWWMCGRVCPRVGREPPRWGGVCGARVCLAPWRTDRLCACTAASYKVVVAGTPTLHLPVQSGHATHQPQRTTEKEHNQLQPPKQRSKTTAREPEASYQHAAKTQMHMTACAHPSLGRPGNCH
jgi:hypothetical protein